MNNDISSMTEHSGFSSQRRSLLLGAAAVASIGGLGMAGAAAAAAEGHDHGHHQHGVEDARQRVIHEAMHCVMRGQACMDHCIELFKKGDTSTAGCADLVQEVVAACGALIQLASCDSRHLKGMVQVCVGICEDCEKECRKHEGKHAACKECAESCAACVLACKEYLA